MASVVFLVLFVSVPSTLEFVKGFCKHFVSGSDRLVFLVVS